MRKIQKMKLTPRLTKQHNTCQLPPVHANLLSHFYSCELLRQIQFKRYLDISEHWLKPTLELSDVRESSTPSDVMSFPELEACSRM